MPHARVDRLDRLAVLLVAVALATGCTPAGPATRAPQVEVPALAHGTAGTSARPTGPVARVTIDPAALLGPAGPRTGYGLAGLEFDLGSHFGIRRCRLMVRGPGLEPITSSEFPWTYTEVGTGEVVEMIVPAGPNRVFTLEGLDSAGHVLASLSTAASLTAGSDVTLRLSPARHGVARVLAALLDGPSGDDLDDAAGMAGVLATRDVVADLVAYVTKVAGYNEATNTFRFVEPRKIRATWLADRLFAQGMAYLANGVPDELRDKGEGTVDLELVDADGAPLPFTFVSVSDPATVGNFTVPGDRSRLRVQGVTAGTWTMQIDTSAGTVWREVTVKDGETVPLRVEVPPGLVEHEPGVTLASIDWNFNSAPDYPGVMAWSEARQELVVASKLLGELTWIRLFGNSVLDRQNVVPTVDGSSTPFFPSDLAWHSDRLYAIHDKRLWAIDLGAPGELPSAAAAKLIAVPGTEDLGAVAVAPDGTLYVTNVTASGRAEIWQVQLDEFDAPTATMIIGGRRGTADGTGTAARLGFGPGSYPDMEMDSGGTLWIADPGANTVRWLERDGGGAWTLSSFEGGSARATRDGEAGVANFDGPRFLALWNGDVVVGEQGGHRLRRLRFNEDDGRVTTLAGTGIDEVTDGDKAPSFGGPTGLAVGPGGRLIVADYGASGGSYVRFVDPPNEGGGTDEEAGTGEDPGAGEEGATP